MTTVLVKQSYLAVAIAEGDEVLAEQLHASRIAIGRRQFLRQERRKPESSQCRPHRCSRADTADQLAVFLGQHGVLPVDCPRLPWKITKVNALPWKSIAIDAPSAYDLCSMGGHRPP